MDIPHGTGLVGITGVICMMRIHLMKTVINSLQVQILRYMMQKMTMILIMSLVDMNNKSNKPTSLPSCSTPFY